VSRRNLIASTLEKVDAILKNSSIIEELSNAEIHGISLYI
jgi:hypothetical protein